MESIFEQESKINSDIKMVVPTERIFLRKPVPEIDTIRKEKTTAPSSQNVELTKKATYGS